MKKQSDIAKSNIGYYERLMSLTRADPDLDYNNSKFIKFNISVEECSNDTKCLQCLQKYFSKINELRKVKSRTEDLQLLN